MFVVGCNTLDVRLVNSTSEGEGMLEICRLGNWVKVCKLGLTENQMRAQVTVACRSLNFTPGHNLNGRYNVESTIIPIFHKCIVEFLLLS